MLPPNWRGWMLDTVPQARGGAFAITPKNGRSGISVPQGSRPTMRLRSSATWIICGSGKS